MVPLSAYIAVSAVLFATGLIGVLIRRTFIIVVFRVKISTNVDEMNLLKW